MKKDEPDAWLRFEGLPGEYVQIDWGEIRNFPFLLQEKTTRYFFCARLKYSRCSYVEFTAGMKQETFIRCILRAFESFGGVPYVCVFDYVPRNIIKIMWPIRLCSFSRFTFGNSAILIVKSGT